LLSVKGVSLPRKDLFDKHSMHFSIQIKTEISQHCQVVVQVRSLANCGKHSAASCHTRENEAVHIEAAEHNI
jgi:hypothetical protein